MALESGPVDSNAAYLACEEQRQDTFQKDAQSEWKYWYSVQAWVKQKLYLYIIAYFFFIFSFSVYIYDTYACIHLHKGTHTL